MESSIVNVDLWVRCSLIFIKDWVSDRITTDFSYSIVARLHVGHIRCNNPGSVDRVWHEDAGAATCRSFVSRR